MAIDEEAALLAEIEAAENRVAALQGLPMPNARPAGPHWTMLQVERVLPPLAPAPASERLLGAMFDLTGKAGTLRTSGETLVWNPFDERWALDSQATLDCGPDATILMLQQRWVVPSVFRAMCAVTLLTLCVIPPLWDLLSWGPFVVATMLPALILMLVGGGRLASRRRLETAVDALAKAVAVRAPVRVRAEAEERLEEEALAESVPREARRGVS